MNRAPLAFSWLMEAMGAGWAARRRFARLGLAVALVLASLAATSPAGAEVFRYATASDVLGLDPYSNNEGTTNAMRQNLYEGLVHRVWDLSLEPALATSWTQLEPTRWRFRLREGVTFHNGSHFDADDVVASYERMRSATSAMRFAVANIERIDRIGPYEIDIVTSTPDPVLLYNLALLLVMDKEWLEENDVQQVVPGSRLLNFSNTHANGTGPFMLEERVPDTRTVLVANPNWWGAPQHNLTRVVFQPIANDATRVAALLSGEVDMIYPVPIQDIDRIERSNVAHVLSGPDLRMIFIGFDVWREESLDMPGSGRNPFRDVRVRRAVYQAIDAEAIVRVVMRGAARPAGLLIGPGVNGYPGDIDHRLPYDPEAAKRLLAEAGYPDGFPVTFDCPTDRYVNDEAICTAIVPMLQRVGIRVIPNFQSKTLFFDKIGTKGGNRTSFFLLGWTPNTFDAYNALQNLMTMQPAGHGIWNAGRYSNPRVEALTQQIATEIDPQRRNALIREAFAIHAEDVGHVPLHQQRLAWGVARSVADIKQRPWDDVDLRYVLMQTPASPPARQ